MLTELQRQELIRRIEDDDANPDDVIPWKQVRAEILDQLQKPCANHSFFVVPQATKCVKP